MSKFKLVLSMLVAVILLSILVLLQMEFSLDRVADGYDSIIGFSLAANLLILHY